jgi:cobalt-zinc-cadmium efflux system outer membrane protein
VITRLGTVLVTAVIGACVPSRATTFGPVAREIDERVGVAASWSDSADTGVTDAVHQLLGKPLTRDAAARIAIAHSRQLQARFDQLGIAASAVASATVLAPTEVDLELKGLSGNGSEVEISVVQDILDLVQLGQRRSVANADLAAAQARAVAATVDLVADVEVAFNEAVAAQQHLELRQTSFEAAAASAEITERMYAAGNTTVLDLARQRDQREQARVEVGRAQVETEVTRERLNELLGLSGDATRWTAANRLDELPGTAPNLDSIERDAVAASLELEALGAESRAAAGRVGIARFRSWLPELGVGVAASRESEEGVWHAGPAIQIGLPLFNQQQGARARANAELRRAGNLSTATAVSLRARARAARQRVLEAHAEARHFRDVILPLRQEVMNETLKQYNAMNATTFELLIARRDLVDAGSQYIDALRRYHNADAAARALRRGGMPEMMNDEPAVTAGSGGIAEH